MRTIIDSIRAWWMRMRIEAGTIEMVPVADTEDGKVIKMPSSLLGPWMELPQEGRDAVIEAIKRATQGQDDGNDQHH